MMGINRIDVHDEPNGSRTQDLVWQELVARFYGMKE
jgi:hypothetical protein